ncbi:sporulation protein [Sulfuricaulis limicola]|uniref:Sporulation protein n=1 Tax=Sulfuricaulis limicola TaxID=1620215 RepID=A0A1B4XDM6_9GAMM|nr:SPOR domain-containing protein [Sulfuricaulis limicola]BAV32905.1 sporulation protein [Sulfuricaulis limicola]
MADRDDARPEFNPKHRIVGAIVLVALVVIFVPMILSGREPPPELKGEREAPPRAEVTETRMVVTPVPVEDPKPPESSDAVKVVQVPVEPMPVPETKSALPAEKPAEAKKPEPASVKTAAVKPEDGWMVQVGTFTNLQNAARLRDKLKTLGHSVHADSVTVSGKKAMRLRVGPFADRAKADKAQALIRKETGVTGVVQSPS